MNVSGQISLLLFLINLDRAKSTTSVWRSFLVVADLAYSNEFVLDSCILFQQQRVACYTV